MAYPMRGPSDETVGPSFSADLLRSARDRALEAIRRLSGRIGPGTSEAEAKAWLLEIQASLGAPKSWHPPQVRFGRNSILAFGERGDEGLRLAEEDIYFLDIGPIFEGHEGDVGRSFAVGGDPEHSRCCADAEAIWQEVRSRWSSTGASGAELYSFAEERAAARGWVLLRKSANGHRIADFPHAARARGSIEGWDAKPAPDRWILEIQIRHPEREFGAFYEDLLNGSGLT